MTQDRLARDLESLGVDVGQTLLVHASLRSFGWVDGGASTVVAALRDVIGEDGNLVVATSTEANSTTSRVHQASIAGMTSDQTWKYVSEMSPFDRHTSPSDAGAISEAVRLSKGAVRSAHPQSSFTALGPAADLLMEGHQLTSHLGESSPLAKLYEMDAHVLLLGVGYESCTALHLAEYRYKPTPPGQTYRCLVSSNGRQVWVSYQGVVLDDAQFELIGNFLDGMVHPRHGYVGNAESRMMPMRGVVNQTIRWMRQHRA